MIETVPDKPLSILHQGKPRKTLYVEMKPQATSALGLLLHDYEKTLKDATSWCKKGYSESFLARDARILASIKSFPQSIDPGWSSNSINSESLVPTDLCREACRTVANLRPKGVGGRVGTTQCYYLPLNGYIGWNCLADFQGDFLHFTYVPAASDSVFYYRDQLGNLLESKNDPGWTLRFFRSSASHPLWHAVRPGAACFVFWVHFSDKAGTPVSLLGR